MNFQEIGYIQGKSSRNQINSRYTFYYKGEPLYRFRITANYSNKIDGEHIYAIYEINNKIGNLGRDIISIDFGGKIEIIESFKIWPLPIPE